jgi:hypothetical protein
METKQLTPEEVQTIKTIRQERSEITDQFGEIEILIQEYEMIKQDLKEKLSSLKKREVKVGQELQEKYGDGTINIEKGEFISNI